jgi:hypothetical protein
MAISDKELGRIFDSSVPTSVQEAVVRLLFGAYKNSVQACQQFEKEEARDLLGYHRWIQVRHELRGLAGRFPGVQAIPHRWHTLLISGQIMMTASSVQDPHQPIRPANYRDAYITSSQLNLYEKEKPIPEGAKFYCILTHGHISNDPKRPSFATIVFPEKDSNSNVHEINLFARFAPLVKTLRGEGGEPPLKLRDVPVENQP